MEIDKYTSYCEKTRGQNDMLQIVDEKEVAERKPYKFSYEAMKKMAKRKKEREIKKIKIASSIFKINSLVEAI